MKFSFSHCAEFVVCANKENNSSRQERSTHLPPATECVVWENGFSVLSLEMVSLIEKKSHLGKLISFGVVCGLDKKNGEKNRRRLQQ